MKIFETRSTPPGVMQYWSCKNIIYRRNSNFPVSSLSIYYYYFFLTRNQMLSTNISSPSSDCFGLRGASQKYTQCRVSPELYSPSFDFIVCVCVCASSSVSDNHEYLTVLLFCHAYTYIYIYSCCVQVQSNMVRPISVTQPPPPPLTTNAISPVSTHTGGW